MGVLSGIRVLEFEAIGPAPFAVMMLADMGADVLRIDRPVEPSDLGPKRAGKIVNVVGRGRRSVTLDLKEQQDCEAPFAMLARMARIDVDPGNPERFPCTDAVASRQSLD